MWHPSELGRAALLDAAAAPSSHMRRYVLIIAGVVVLAWGILALALGAADLGIGGSSSSESAALSPQCLPSKLEPDATLPGTSVAASPAPGAVSANPQTRISFLGAQASQISAVSVDGAESGRHTGSLRAFSQGDGASFIPSEPFAAGENVHVSVSVDGTPKDFSFRVDTPFPTAGAKEFPNLKASPADYQTFYTLPGARPPVMTVTLADRDPAAGDILTTNGPGPGQYGPLIYSPQGRLVWFQRMPAGITAEDLNEQSFEGSRVLTWWRGRVLSYGFGQGEDVIMDSSYRTLARVAAGNGLKADLHEFQIAPHGVAYVTAYNPVRCDLSSVHGSKSGTIIDGAIQEIDIKTGLVRWEWHSLDHIAAAESEVETPEGPSPWDYFHLNSIAPLPGGKLLISARSTWAAYELNGSSGRVIWRLGGNKSSFKMGPGTKTAWQHDARMLSDGDVTLFDDGANPPIHSESRSLRIHLDLDSHEATLVSSFTHPSPPLLAVSQGNSQTLPSGNTLVGYGGGVPAISEHAPDGTLLFDAHQPLDMSFYRAFRYPWTGRPAAPPAVAASTNNTGEETIVHASWNGATGVDSWRILAGDAESSLAVKATIPDSGFESSTTLPKRYSHVEVQALDSAGKVLASSKPTTVISYKQALPGGEE